MNIGGSLGMANMINDAGVSVIAGSMSATNGALEVTGESTFQRMMAQMMTSNGMIRQSDSAAQAGSQTPIEGIEKESNGIGQALAGLLFGNAGQIKLKIENAVGEGQAIKDSSTVPDKDSDSSEQGAVSLASILARFDGPVNAYLVSEDGSSATELTKSILDIDARKALAESIGADGNGVGLINRMTNLLNSEVQEKSDAAKIISQTIGDDGKVSLLAEINGRSIEFTGLLREHSSKQTEGYPDSPKGPAAMGISEMTVENDQGIQRAGSMTKNIAVQTGFEMGMKAAQQPEKAVQDVSFMSSAEEGRITPKDESGISSIEESLQPAAYQGQLQTTAKAEAVEMNQPSQSAGNAEAYGQIREEILSKLEQKGPTEFKMQLKPEELGAIDISLKLSEGKLIIDILAANAKTQTLLASQVDKLISSMGLQNVQVESINVSQQMNSQNQDNNQSQGYTMNSSMDFSQRKQQEQYRQELQNNATLTGAFGRQQDETQIANPMNRMESIRYDSHRINYAV